GVLSAATPLRAGSITKLPWQQARTSLKVEVNLMGAGHTEWIRNEKSTSDHLASEGLAKRHSGLEGRFTGTIWQRQSEGLFFLVVMCASRFRYCAFTERHRIGGARKKRGSQRPPATLRWEIHATQQVLEARVGAQAVESRQHLQVCKLAVALLIGLFEPLECPAGIA